MKKMHVFFWWLWNHPEIVWMKIKSYLKLLWYSFFPVKMFLILKNTDKEIWKLIGKNILGIFGPLLIFFIFFNMLLLMGSFLLWTTPHRWYMPFCGGSNQMIFDRLLLLVGLIIVVFKKQL